MGARTLRGLAQAAGMTPHAVARHEAARCPEDVALVVRDERGYDRGAAPGRDWSAAVPVAARGGPNNRQWRLIGALNALAGQVSYHDADIMGRERVSAFSHQLVAT